MLRVIREKVRHTIDELGVGRAAVRRSLNHAGCENSIVQTGPALLRESLHEVDSISHESCWT